MNYLGLALYAEGPTDHRFLCPLLFRLCEDLCARYGERPVEIGEVIPLDVPVSAREQNGSGRLFEAARQGREGWHVLFVHTDAAGDQEAARHDRVEPGALRIVAELQVLPESIVAVIPVREMEAWTLADGDAVRRTFGTVLPDADLGVPARPQEVETIADPKRVLENAFHAGRPPHRRRRDSHASRLEALGERVSLERLRKVPAFVEMEGELLRALALLQYIRDSSSCT